MAIGYNWAEIWAPIWGPVWAPTAPPAGETPIGYNWAPIWRRAIWGDVWAPTAGEPGTSWGLYPPAELPTLVGTLGLSGDIEWSLGVHFEIDPTTIALVGTLSLSGDITATEEPPSIADMPRVELRPIAAGVTRTQAFDFISLLAAGDSLFSVSFSCEVYSGVDASPSAVLSGAPDVDGTKVWQALVGRTPGVIYAIVASALTTEGEELYLAGLLPVLSA